MIVLASHDSIARAAEIIRHGGLVAFPTETVYGLGASALSDDAIRKIYAAKGRPSNNPLIVHISEQSELSTVADTESVDQSVLQKLTRFWPGPLSLVLPKKSGVSALACGGLSSVAVRVPQHPVARALIREAGVPIAAPSANVSTYVSPTSAQHVQDGLGSKVDLILDAGSCAVGLESTIVSLISNPPELLRPGRITYEELKTLIPNLKLRDSSNSASILAPGMLKEHYAPRTPVLIRGQRATSEYPRNVGLICFRSPLSDLEFPYSKISVLSESGDLEEVSRNLFAALREQDAASLDLIVVDSCPTIGLGRAIMDRLIRASAKSANND